MRDIMNIVQDLFEMPEMTSDEDFGLSSPKMNRELTVNFLKDKHTVKVGEIRGHNLYKQNNRFALIDETLKNDPRTVYYMKYEVNHINMLNSDAAQQIAVWRERGTIAIGVASDMFFNFLLPMTGCIVTDLFQTSYGKRFWGDRISDAFQRGLKVLYINTTNKSITQIGNMEELDALEDEIWGNGDQYQHRRVVIMK